MRVVMRITFACFYIYIVGLGAYAYFFGLPQFDTRNEFERSVDGHIERARDTRCRIAWSLSQDGLNPNALADRADCTPEATVTRSAQGLF